MDNGEKFIIILSTEKRLTQEEREKFSNFAFRDEDIYKDLDSAICKIVDVFNPLYFYHIIRLHALSFEAVTYSKEDFEIDLLSSKNKTKYKLKGI